ncbi:CorA family divalent cation transporter [Desulfurobacterium sp.]|uniref:CorA family divalent cation transporter n=1 Tax=Desulfurobacterium sp. TaxID=2004706 RepID=UPI002628E470|nr:CorA family divalent cation transporter [Desulfurobacterium sp.]
MGKCWLLFKTDNGIETDTLDVAQLYRAIEKRPIWIHFRNLDEEIEDFLLEKLKINELSLEDATFEDRPKAETFENYVFVLLKSIHYLRDLADELVMLYDHIDTLHEMLQNIFSVFSSLVEFKLNDIMKTLTIIMTVFAPITMISGYYGMNIVDLPFADSHIGLFIVTGMMVLMSMAFMVYFRKKQWI